MCANFVSIGDDVLVQNFWVAFSRTTVSYTLPNLTWMWWYWVLLVVSAVVYSFHRNENLSKFREIPVNQNVSMINYKPVRYEKNNTLIITFIDILYFETAKLWFVRMEKLGYAEKIKIYALDDVVFKELTEFSKQSNSTLGLNQIELVNQFFVVDKTKKIWKPNLKRIWHIRIQKISSLLQEGY